MNGRKTENYSGNKRRALAPRRTRPDGFTLIELMVAITLLTVITGIVYSSFASVAMTIEETRLASAELQLRQYLTRSFSMNLAQVSEDWLPGAAYRDAQSRADETEDPEGVSPPVQQPTQDPNDPFGDAPQDRFWFEGVDEEGPYGPADRLRFITSARVIGPEGLPGISKEVTYEVQSGGTGDQTMQSFDEDGQPRLPFPTLFVTETPMMQEPPDSGYFADRREPNRDGYGTQNPDAGDRDAQDRHRPTYGRTARQERRAETDTAYPGDESTRPQVAPGWRVLIRSMDLRYFDGEEWLDEWNSAEMGRLPWSVDIRINFARTEEELIEEEFAGYDFIEDPDLHLVVTIPTGAGVMDEKPEYIRTGTRGFDDSETDAMDQQ